MFKIKQKRRVFDLINCPISHIQNQTAGISWLEKKKKEILQNIQL